MRGHQPDILRSRDRAVLQGIAMLRKFLLPALALAALGGCATGYGYRGGQGGDYYYGNAAQVGYGSAGPYVGVGIGGYYGGGYGYYGARPVLYYDRFGRVVYGSGYGYYGYPPIYGYPYASPYPYPYRPTRPGGHQPRPGTGDQDDHGDRNDRKPPWRNFGGLAPGATPEGGTRAVRQDAMAQGTGMRPVVQDVAPARVAPRAEFSRPAAAVQRTARETLPGMREVEE